MPFFKYDPVNSHSLENDDKKLNTTAHSAQPFMGPVDIYESADGYVFVTDCPGLSSKNVHVRVTHDLLQISGEREATKIDKDHQMHRLERASGKFCRTFRLPASADYQNVKAMCEHGVLKVTVAKNPKLQEEAFARADAAAEAEGDGSLNAEFESVPLSIFPTPALGKIIVIDSDTSILDAVNILSDNHVLSAPVRDVSLPEDAAWTDKYIGMLDMVGIVFHMLEHLGDDHDPSDFQEEIKKIDTFRNMTAKEAISFARFGPFVPVDHDKGNLLDCMLLAGHHAIRRVPCVKSPGGDIVNIITQSALVQTLSANLQRFQSVGQKTMRELGFGEQGRLYTVTVEQPLKDAFKLIKERDISAVPVVDDQGKIVGNISARDVRLIVSSAKIYKLLNMSIKAYLDVVNSGVENSAICCSPDDTMEDIIKCLVRSRIHRVYLVDQQGRPLRVVSLRNVLKKFCQEPQGYFSRFFSYVY